MDDETAAFKNGSNIPQIVLEMVGKDKHDDFGSVQRDKQLAK